MPIKIAMIGAGSVGFTRALTKDILAVPELVDTEFAFTDISKNKSGDGGGPVQTRHQGIQTARKGSHVDQPHSHA